MVELVRGIKMETLKEIKRGQSGTGLLIESDGYISMDMPENKKLFESFDSKASGELCPYPFVVSAVFQKNGIENANGRIYPESVLKKAVEEFNVKLKERRAIGECYTPRASVFTENGWMPISDVKEGDRILSLNTETGSLDIQSVERKIEYEYNGDMIHITGNNIDDIVTPNHGYPVYSNKKFIGFYTSQDIYDKNIPDIDNAYIPVSHPTILHQENSVNDDIYIRDVKCELVGYSGMVMCVEVPNHTFFVMDGNKAHWTKNCNHPSETTVDLGRVSHNIIELHWEGQTLVGKMEILTTPGFRKYGISSTYGDQMANLLMSGIKIGVSSRGVGSVSKSYDKLIVGNDYEIVTWDIVSDPSTPNAWIVDKGEIPSLYIENKKASNKPIVDEKVNRLKNFSEWLNI